MEYGGTGIDHEQEEKGFPDQHFGCKNREHWHTPKRSSGFDAKHAKFKYYCRALKTIVVNVAFSLSIEAFFRLSGNPYPPTWNRQTVEWSIRIDFRGTLEQPLETYCCMSIFNFELT